MYILCKKNSKHWKRISALVHHRLNKWIALQTAIHSRLDNLWLIRSLLVLPPEDPHTVDTGSRPHRSEVWGMTSTQCKTVVAPLLTNWRYNCLELSLTMHQINHWLGSRQWYLLCINDGDTKVLHRDSGKTHLIINALNCFIPNASAW